MLRIYADASGVRQGVVQAQGQVNGLRASVARNAGLIRTAIGGAFVAGAVVAVRAASDLGEAQNKVNVIFGESSRAVTEFAENSASIGLATAEALDAAGAFGSMFDAAGLASAESAEMSTTMVALAGDMASFNNTDPSEMLERLRSGLAGEAEPLRRFGVFISEAAVNTEALASGLVKQGQELTDVQRIQARYNIIMRDTTKQQGDFARTSNSLPNLLRTLRAELINVAASVGQKLLPVVVGVVRGLRAMIGPVTALAPLFVALGVALATVWTVGKIGALAGAIYNVSGSATALAIASSSAAGPIGVAAAAIGLIAMAAIGSQDPLRDLRADLVDLGMSLPNATRETNRLAAAQGEAAVGARFSGRFIQILTEKTAAGGDAANDAAGQSRYYATMLEAETGKLRGATKGTLDYRRAKLLLAGGLLGVVAQLNTLRDAQREVNRLEDAGKRGTREYKDAKITLLQEIVATKDGLIEYGQELQHEGQTYPQVRANLVKLGREYGLTRADVLDVLSVIKDVNNEWAKTPKNVHTNYSINLTGDVSGANALGLDFGQRQGGGPVAHGQPYIVGEAGPELFVPNGAGQIIPNHELPAAGGVSITINGDVTDPDRFARKVEQALNRAAARH